MLVSLTYMSTAVRMPTYKDIEHLLSRARERNEREHVTGVLLFSEGSFMQVIEGPKDGIDIVYAAIVADPLHHHILELLRDEIDARAFADWTMAYRAVGSRTVEPDDALTAKLEARPGDLSAVNHLLAAFWNNGLGARYSALRR